MAAPELDRRRALWWRWGAWSLMVLALSVGVIWILFIWEPSAPDRRHVADAAIGRADFELTAASGPVRLKDFRGKAVLLYFGYSACPDVCPTNLAILALALRGLTAAERERVRVMFVSVDPARDTAARLQVYARYFHPDMLGLTGSPERIAAAARAFGAVYRRIETTDSAMGYLIDHSADTYLIDPRGRWRATLSHATPAERIQDAIRDCLADSA